jgi:hypothetical protein
MIKDLAKSPQAIGCFRSRVDPRHEALTRAAAAAAAAAAHYAALNFSTLLPLLSAVRRFASNLMIQP